jgi:hypothetical protein
MWWLLMSKFVCFIDKLFVGVSSEKLGEGETIIIVVQNIGSQITFFVMNKWRL